MRCSGVPNEHHVQDTFVFLPTGTIDRGTPKHDSVGTVLSGSIAHLIRCSPAGEAAFIPCPEEAGASAPGKEGDGPPPFSGPTGAKGRTKKANSSSAGGWGGQADAGGRTRRRLTCRVGGKRTR